MNKLKYKKNKNTLAITKRNWYLILRKLPIKQDREDAIGICNSKNLNNFSQREVFSPLTYTIQSDVHR